MGDQSVANIHKEAQIGREHKRHKKHRKMVYYSYNGSLRREDRKNSEGKKNKEIIAWNFPKPKKDIKVEI